MPGPPFLHGDRLTLCPVEPTDHEFLQRHWNDPALRHWFARTEPMDGDALTGFLDDEAAVHFLPCRDGEPVGFLWLFRLDDVAGRGELGYWVAPDEQGNGYATEAAGLGLRYAFDERGLHRVVARVLDGNSASRRVLEKLGFEREGCLRDHYYVDGDHVDAELFGLLADER